MGRQIATILLALLTTVCVVEAVNAQAKDNGDVEASAQSIKEARRHFETGVTLLKAEDWNGAASEFEASLELYPTKTAYYNLANGYRALHRYADALKVFEQLLRDYEGQLVPEMATDAKKQWSELKQLIATLLVEVNTSGAQVLVDGQTIEETSSSGPVVLVLGPGTYKIEVVREGFVPAEQQVRLVAGEERHEKIALEPLAEPVGIARPHPMVWVGLGTTLALGTTTGVLWGVANKKYGEYDADRTDEDLKEEVRLYNSLAVGFSIGTGVALIATTVFWIVDYKKRHNEARNLTFTPGSIQYRF